MPRDLRRDALGFLVPALGFLTYDVAPDPVCAAYCQCIMAFPAMQEWVAQARQEPDEIDELDAEF